MALVCLVKGSSSGGRGWAISDIVQFRIVLYIHSDYIGPVEVYEWCRWNGWIDLVRYTLALSETARVAGFPRVNSVCGVIASRY